LEKLIGEGAMGHVYMAQQIQLRRKAALKILRRSLVSDPTVVARFQREAHAASRLDQRNCISIYDFGQEDKGELLWMAMEFVEGRDLGTIIAEDAPLPTARVIHIISQVCEALDEAHSAKIIHRDLKPANIVCFDHRRTKDFVKVLDFGIAKIIDPGEDYQPLTQAGIVCGTPAYMSPEQVQGYELDPRSDLFSLGIILYQTLTGQLPFFAESAVEVATKIVIEEPPKPSTVRLDWSYPPELEAITLKLLKKDREQRYSSALEVKEALTCCSAILHERRDASLDMSPDELAGLMADIDAPLEGAATLRLSTDVIAHAMAMEQASGVPAQLGGPQQSPAQFSRDGVPAQLGEPQKSPAQLSREPSSLKNRNSVDLTKGLSSAFLKDPPTEKRSSLSVLLLLLLLSGAGVAYYFLYLNPS